MLNKAKKAPFKVDFINQTLCNVIVIYGKKVTPLTMLRILILIF
jgi:hypothetical protein